MKLIGYVAVFGEDRSLLFDTHLPLNKLLHEGYFNLTFGRLRQKYRQRKAIGAVGVYLGENVSQLLSKLTEETSDCVEELISKLKELPDNKCVYLGVGLNPQLVNFCLTNPLPLYCEKTYGPIVLKTNHLSRKMRRRLTRLYENLEVSVGMRSV